jgi:hypothetical protein
LISSKPPVSNAWKIDIEDAFGISAGNRREDRHAGPDQFQTGFLIEPAFDLRSPISLMKDQTVTTQMTAGSMNHFPEDLTYARDLIGHSPRLSWLFSDGAVRPPSNPEFRGYTLLVFRPFILYNPSKMAEASA